MMTRKQHIRYGLLFALVLTGAGLWYATRPDEAELPIEKLMGPTPAVWGIRQQAIPTIRVADIVGWKDGQKPVA